jgi:leucyl aminopeptidase (aminopeptidase T)
MSSFTLALVPVTLAAVIASVAAAPAQSPNNDVVADNLVNQSLDVQPGEVVLITGNPDQIELLSAVFVAVSKAGGQPIVALNIPEAAKRALIETPMAYLEQIPTAPLLLAKIVDAQISVVSVPDPDLLADVPEERLAATREASAEVSQVVANLQRRFAALGQTGGIPTTAWAASMGADYGESIEIFWQAVQVPASQLAARAQAVADKLTPQASVRLTSAAGTDLTLEIGSFPARINAGRTADVVSPTRGSSTWLPAGEAYACVAPGSASGTLVVPFYNFRGQHVENLKMTFEGGRLTAMSADTNEGKLREYMDSTDADSKELSIIDFGVNERSRPPTGSRGYSWEMGGLVTLGVGNSSWAGCDNYSDGNVSPHVPDLSVTVDGEMLLMDGKLED